MLFFKKDTEAQKINDICIFKDGNKDGSYGTGKTVINL